MLNVDDWFIFSTSNKKLNILRFLTGVVEGLKDIFDNSGGLKWFKCQGHMEKNQKTKAHAVVYMSEFEELVIVVNW